VPCHGLLAADKRWTGDLIADNTTIRLDAAKIDELIATHGLRRRRTIADPLTSERVRQVTDSWRASVGAGLPACSPGDSYLLINSLNALLYNAARLSARACFWLRLQQSVDVVFGSVPLASSRV
jgi:hypothetical protein